MNDPFDGVYQIKRSSAASYLLQIKWLVANQPWGKDIRFDTRAAFVPEFDGDVLEVVGKDGRKSLGSTMKMMESVQEAVTTAAAIVSEAPEKVGANGVNGEYVDDKVVSSTSLDQIIQVVPPTSSTASKENVIEELPSLEVESKAANAHLPSSKVTIDPEQEQTVVNDANGSSDVKESAAHNMASLSKDQIEPAITDTPEAAPIINQSVLRTTHQQSQLDTSSIKCPREQSAKDYLPSYFRTLSGFNEDEKKASKETSVTVPTLQIPQSNSRISGGDRQTVASANYFRHVGGFMH